jgi:transcriptional regulator with GAF, ATPase, and Fis domain/predicted Ser/Thr protein kinase
MGNRRRVEVVVASEFPYRYEPLKRLGQGGGGEVWAVRDRSSSVVYALKMLAQEASEREMAALVREAAALSGLEGLGVPRVIAFGRLPRTGRAFMVRELVEGQSLQTLVEQRGDIVPVLSALVSACDQLTVVHRAGLLHGDVKPANLIVAADGHARLVDLGRAAPFREGGSIAEGLSPRYAAPELFEGKPLTVRAEVYALGVTLAEALELPTSEELPPSMRSELTQISARATAHSPQDRHPSVDEFASAVRRAAGLKEPAPSQSSLALLWPVTGIDAISGQILDAAHALGPGGRLELQGAAGSGRTALLRRLAWSLGVEGERVVAFEQPLSVAQASSELEAYSELSGLFVLVDDADRLDPAIAERLTAAQGSGARLITVGGAALGARDRSIVIPPLESHAARDLVRRSVPSLGEAGISRVIELSGGRPGELRRLVRLIASEAVASAADVERVVGPPSVRFDLPREPLDQAMYYLDRGRYGEAERVLAQLSPSEHGSVRLAIARGRLELGMGDAPAARERLAPYVDSAPTEFRDELLLYLGRAELGVGNYARVDEVLGSLSVREGRIGVEALAFHGLGLSFLGRHEEARAELDRAVERARAQSDPRLLAVTLLCRGLERQRVDQTDEAQQSYEQTILAAEQAGDAGTLAVVRANLAGLLKVRGDIAGAIEQFEAALDMGVRSGRRQTVRQALLNLANLDLYLGRVARARQRIEALEEQREQLPAVTHAQLLGLNAELSLKEGKLERAVMEYEASASAYEALGRCVDAAEARLEGVLAAVRLRHPNANELRERLDRARAELRDTAAHRPLLLLAAARVASVAGDEAEARARLSEALVAARESGQREWTWRALENRAELEELGGQPHLARRDREEAVVVLEEIGARLPRDLREVYWNDPRRAQLRSSVPAAIGSAATEFTPFSPGVRASHGKSATTLSRATTSLSQLSSTPLEQRLSRILEVNAELAAERELPRLTARITDFAVELAQAERGVVLLRSGDGSLAIHTSRAMGADVPDPDFSRSIAERVLDTREPIVTLSARDDARMKGYASVHQMALESVACVPILAPGGSAIGALYVETRQSRGAHFERELPTLRAFADQMAIALESARLIDENRRRADELAEANRSLNEAQVRLRELLGDRTEQLKRTRRRLKDVHETLYSHFGYHGLVGTSAAMRRVYALIERVKETDVPVLIVGESGTGKEMVARAIHETSPRSKAKMLGVNCGAIPENLLESELFGHVRGAFTGAERDRKGLFRECDGGTILLDEIGETPPKMQASLLRVLQEHRVRPVGGGQEEAVDVRVICATNRDLQALVHDKKFREDLYYRIHVVEVRVPALRSRVEDLPQLVDHFLGLFAARYKREKKSLSREALRKLSEYDWPGNVRQLENVLLNAWVMSEEDELSPHDFDLPERSAPAKKTASPAPAAADPPARRGQKGTTSEHHRNERERILEALRACNWNRVKAAELSGIPRRTFYRRLREYGIQ